MAATLPATCKPAASALRQAQVQQLHRRNGSAAEDEIAAVRVELEGSKHDTAGAERPNSGKPLPRHGHEGYRYMYFKRCWSWLPLLDC